MALYNADKHAQYVFTTVALFWLWESTMFTIIIIRINISSSDNFKETLK